MSAVYRLTFRDRMVIRLAELGVLGFAIGVTWRNLLWCECWRYLPWPIRWRLWNYCWNLQGNARLTSESRRKSA